MFIFINLCVYIIWRQEFGNAQIFVAEWRHWKSFKLGGVEKLEYFYTNMPKNITFKMNLILIETGYTV